MDLDFDRIFEPEIKPAHDGVYDEEEEMEKFYAHQAELEHEFEARSQYEKQEEWLCPMAKNWHERGSVGAGILMYLYWREEWL